jgi:hypothetical protein
LNFAETFVGLLTSSSSKCYNAIAYYKAYMPAIQGHTLVCDIKYTKSVAFRVS